MNYHIEKITTPSGRERYELRVWGYGRNHEQFKRRYEDKKTLFQELSEFEKNEDGLGKSDLTFRDLYETFLERRALTFSPGWQKSLKGYWRELEPEISMLPPLGVNSDKLDSIEKLLLQKGNSQRTANMKIGFIQAVMNFALEMDLISENRARKFKKKKPVEPVIEFWERDDAEDFLTYASAKYPRGSKDRWKYVVYLVGVNAGLRAGEIWALKPRCLKRSLGLIHINEQFDRVARVFRPPKGKGPRNVPLNETILDELEELIERRQISRHELMFPNTLGLAMDHDNFKERIFGGEFGASKKGKWEGPKIKFHGLRHTAATLMLSSGVDVRTVKEILGHKDLATTMKYVHLLGSSVKDAAEKFAIRPRAPGLKVVKEFV